LPGIPGRASRPAIVVKVARARARNSFYPQNKGVEQRGASDNQIATTGREQFRIAIAMRASWFLVSTAGPNIRIVGIRARFTRKIIERQCKYVDSAIETPYSMCLLGHSKSGGFSAPQHRTRLVDECNYGVVRDRSSQWEIGCSAGMKSLDLCSALPP
jgi:hypothetical protein